jgi:glycosyltransferase involved in cell wall biosynthesis
VLCVTQCLAFGGTEKHLVDLVHRLAPDTEVTILCYGLDPYTDRLGDLPAGSVRVHSDLGEAGFLAHWRRFVRARPRTVVFVNGDLGLFPWFAYLAARLSGRVRVVGIEHLIATLPPPPIGGAGLLAGVRRLVGWRARRMLALRMQGILSDWTICVSHAVARRLTSQYGFPRRRTVTIWNGIDLTYYRPAAAGRPGARATVRRDLGIDPRASVLLCVARLAPQKCVDVLLRAVATVSSTDRRLRCLVVGDGPLRQDLTELRDALGLGANVHFVGHRDDVRPFLEASDVYVTASRREGFGLSLVEAMAYALPCIATDIGGHDEIIEHERSGLLVRPESADELARAISYLLAHEAERERLGRLGQERVRACFDLEDAMGQIVGILRDGTLRPRRGARPVRARPAAIPGPVGDRSCES